MRERLDRDVRSLVGRRIVSVSYFEITTADDVPLWDGDPDFDTLDHGLELRFDDGDRCWITWGWKFYSYSLEIEINTSEDRTRMRERDASETRWSGLLQRQITGAQIYWAWQESAADGRRWGPQDLELTFDGGQVVFISALEVWSARQALGEADTITVFFDADVARRYPVGPFTSSPNVAPAGSSSSGLIG